MIGAGRGAAELGQVRQHDIRIMSMSQEDTLIGQGTVAEQGFPIIFETHNCGIMLP